VVERLKVENALLKSELRFVTLGCCAIFQHFSCWYQHWTRTTL
jgi:hypothetical protein